VTISPNGGVPCAAPPATGAFAFADRIFRQALRLRLPRCPSRVRPLVMLLCDTAGEGL